ncbi:extracellular solute-binding protein [Paenibacillus sp. GCM10027626]|uniref:extracellular solute-binding protein n=1 Tax=Paenibacillus sp. GCM10027626 TaxID=3273411 RepID=UPI00363C7612
MPIKKDRKTYGERLDYMIRDLQRLIAAGTYPPGGYLPPESKLAEEYALSNKSVRKGLEQLVAEGAITKINRVGNQVTGRSAADKAVITLGYTESIERDLELQQMLEEFHQQHPSIQVNTILMTPMGPSSHVRFPETVEPYLVNGIIDVFTVNQAQFLEFAEQQALELLEPLEPEAGAYHFLNDSFTAGGRQYVLPIVFSPVILCYNREHFRKAGMAEPDSSWTWHDTIRHAEALARPGERFGLYFYLMSENRWPIFLLQGMHEGISRERFASEMKELVRLVKLMLDHPAIFPKYLTEGSDDVNQLFLQEKVSMMLSSYFSLNELKHTKVPYDITPLPYLHRQGTLNVTIGMAVNRHTKQKEAAMTLVRYFASKKSQQAIRERTFSIPAHKAVAEQVGKEKYNLNRPPHYPMFRELFPSFQSHRELRMNAAQFQAARTLLKNYWSGLITEEKLWEELPAYLPHMQPEAAQL